MFSIFTLKYYLEAFSFNIRVESLNYEDSKGWTFDMDIVNL